MTKHVLYTAKDFTPEEAERGNVLYKYVVEQGLDICRLCNASEGELAKFDTCQDYRRWSRYDRYVDLLKLKGRQVITGVLPCCGNTLESEQPRKGEVWDSLTVCPFCGELIQRQADQDKLTFNQYNK